MVWGKKTEGASDVIIISENKKIKKLYQIFYLI